MVKVNGTPINLETVIKRFQPEARSRNSRFEPKFEPSDCVSLEKLEERALSLGREANRARETGEIPENSSWYTGWHRDSMGWRFLYWVDGYGHKECVCFAPLTGKVEITEGRGIKAIEYALDHGLPLE